MGCNYSKAPQDQAGQQIRGIVSRQPELAAGSVPRVKLVLIGACGVGKSSLVLRYVREQFDPASKVTIGAAFMSHTVHLPDGQSVKFEIWDTAGQERFSSLVPLYYRGAQAAVVVYDITDAESFTRAKQWVTELQKNARNSIAIIFVGNKLDLAHQRAVSIEEGLEYADRNQMMFIETSAKTSENVREMFEKVAEKVSSPKPTAAQPPLPTSVNPRA